MAHLPPTLRLIAALMDAAGAKGCYKVILDCSEANAPFYEKCGLTKKEVQMVGPCAECWHSIFEFAVTLNTIFVSFPALNLEMMERASIAQQLSASLPALGLFFSLCNKACLGCRAAAATRAGVDQQKGAQKTYHCSTGHWNAPVLCQDSLGAGERS